MFPILTLYGGWEPLWDGGSSCSVSTLISGPWLQLQGEVSEPLVLAASQVVRSAVSRLSAPPVLPAILQHQFPTFRPSCGKDLSTCPVLGSEPSMERVGKKLQSL